MADTSTKCLALFVFGGALGIIGTATLAGYLFAGRDYASLVAVLCIALSGLAVALIAAYPEEATD